MGVISFAPRFRSYWHPSFSQQHAPQPSALKTGKYAEICTYSHGSRRQRIKIQTTENLQALRYNNGLRGIQPGRIQSSHPGLRWQRGAGLQSQRGGGGFVPTYSRSEQPWVSRAPRLEGLCPRQSRASGLGGTGCDGTQDWGGGVLAVAPAALFPRAGTSPGISRRQVVFPLSWQRARALARYKGQASGLQGWVRV